MKQNNNGKYRRIDITERGKNIEKVIEVVQD